MGCLLTIVGIFYPQICMIFILLTTDWFSTAYDSFIWPFLGYFLMPYTTLTYMAAMINNAHSVNGGWSFLIMLAIFVDLSIRTYELQSNLTNNS